MKTLLCALLLCTTACLAQNASDFPINVRVIESRVRPTANFPVQRIIVLINGSKYELEATGGSVFALGEYKAKLQEKSKNDYNIRRTYSLLLPDGKTRDFYLSGIFQ